MKKDSKIEETPQILEHSVSGIDYLSAEDKVEQFKKEFKLLLLKFDAEMTIEDFGRDWASDDKIVVSFNYDEGLSKRINNGIVPDWVIGTWENGK